MLLFRIEDIDHQRVADISTAAAEVLNDKYPPTDAAANLANTVAIAVVCVGWLQKIAFAMDVDATELFEGIADAIDDGALPSFE